VASFGASEVLTHPFLATNTADRLGLPNDDERRLAVRVSNPLSEAEPELRTSVLPGLILTALRNLSRGSRNLALYEVGVVFFDRPGSRPAPVAGVEHRPSEDEIAAMNAPIPRQPWHLGVLLVGDLEPAGWQGPAHAADWGDAVEFAQRALRESRVEVAVRQVDTAPWHPGRCAQFVVGGTVVGHAGELHPRVVAEFGLPARVCAVELDLDVLTPPGPAAAPALSSYPPVLLDVALVVSADVSAASVAAALRAGGGELVDSVRLFDVYLDAERLGPGQKSLAFAMRLRSADRTLTTEEASVARDAAIARAGELTGAMLRS
jgi:phenylalanyl-tRNA synthetase beta chain